MVVGARLADLSITETADSLHFSPSCVPQVTLVAQNVLQRFQTLAPTMLMFDAFFHSLPHVTTYEDNSGPMTFNTIFKGGCIPRTLYR